MGSVNNVSNIDRWRVLLKGDSKILKDDIIYEVIIGSCSDGNEYYDLIEYISKENYDSIMNGKYTFKAFPYSNQKIIIFDENNNIVPLVKGRDDEEYTPSQIEYVKKLRKSYK